MYEILSLTSFKTALFKKWQKHVILIKRCVTWSTRNTAISVVVVQSLSYFQPFVTPRTAAHQTSQSFTISGVFSNSCPSSWWCHPTISSSIVPSPPAFNLSNMSVLCIKQPNYWSFSFSISPSNEYLGLISFRTDWFELLAVQETLKSFSNTTVQKHQFFGTHRPTLTSIHDYWKNHSFD